MLGFLREDGLDVAGLEVADVGCGDGIIDLGLVHHGKPDDLSASTSIPYVKTSCSSARSRRRSPTRCRSRSSSRSATPRSCRRPTTASTSSSPGRRSSTSTIPRPCSREIRRVLRPDGALFLQLWPFYHSQHGAHLDEWYPEGFVQFQRDADAIEADVLARADDEGWARYKLGEYRTLNELTVDDLGHAVEAAGFRITKLQLISERVPLPPEVRGMDLSRLGISGIMLLAR